MTYFLGSNAMLRAQGYSDMGRYMLAPVSYEALDHASGFASEQCPEGFCAVARNTLRILTVERLGETFNQQARSRVAARGAYGHAVAQNKSQTAISGKCHGNPQGQTPGVQYQCRAGKSGDALNAVCLPAGCAAFQASGISGGVAARRCCGCGTRRASW